VKTALLPLSFVLIAATAASQTQDWGDWSSDWANAPEFEQSKALCRAVRDRDPPAADAPTAAEAAALRGCSSEALYYGIGMPADPVRARHCAFLEAQAGEADGQPLHLFSGRAMLMTIYANGVGARRDLDVAIHLACQVDGAPAESHGRVSRLAQLRDERWTGTDFHVCDDITSGLAGGYCAGHRASIAELRREAEIERLTAGWPDDHRRAFQTLRAAHDAYLDARVEGELELSGTLRIAIQVEEQQAHRDQLVEMIHLLERAGAQPFRPNAFPAADSDLNAAYRAALRGDPDDETVAARVEGIRSAQRAWLRYRDAFLDFASLRYPRTPRGALAAWLTVQRTELLASPEH